MKTITHWIMKKFFVTGFPPWLEDDPLAIALCLLLWISLLIQFVLILS